MYYVYMSPSTHPLSKHKVRPYTVYTLGHYAFIHDDGMPLAYLMIYLEVFFHVDSTACIKPKNNVIRNNVKTIHQRYIFICFGDASYTRR